MPDGKKADNGPENTRAAIEIAVVTFMTARTAAAVKFGKRILGERTAVKNDAIDWRGVISMVSSNLNTIAPRNYGMFVWFPQPVEQPGFCNQNSIERQFHIAPRQHSHLFNVNFM